MNLHCRSDTWTARAACTAKASCAWRQRRTKYFRCAIRACRRTRRTSSSFFSRVVTKLGSLAQVNPKVIEGLYAADLAYLQEFYNRINRDGRARVEAVCPKCENVFAVELDGVGGFSATP